MNGSANPYPIAQASWFIQAFCTCVALLLLEAAVGPVNGQASSQLAMSPDAAKKVLDDPTWADRDPEAERVRTEKAPQEMRDAHLKSYVSRREIEAIQTLSSVVTSQGRDFTELIPYLKHPNTAVAVAVAGTALKTGHWELGTAIAERLPSCSAHEQAAVLPSPLGLGQHSRAASSLARVVLGSRLSGPESEDRGYDRHAVTVAVRLLVRSLEPNDAQLLGATVRQFPSEPLLWAALSRTDVPKEMIAEARRVFEDGAKPPELRAAAALVLRKSDIQVMENVVGWIKDYIREFGGDEFVEWMRTHFTGPQDAQYNAKMQRFNAGESFLVVLRELPSDVLSRYAAEILSLGPRTLDTVGPILARRVPAKLVQTLTEWPQIPHELYPALYLAMNFDPSLTERAKALIPPSEFSRLESIVEMKGLDLLASSAATITLWD